MDSGPVTPAHPIRKTNGSRRARQAVEAFHRVVVAGAVARQRGENWETGWSTWDSQDSQAKSSKSSTKQQNIKNPLFLGYVTSFWGIHFNPFQSFDVLGFFVFLVWLLSSRAGNMFRCNRCCWWLFLLLVVALHLRWSSLLAPVLCRSISRGRSQRRFGGRI